MYAVNCTSKIVLDSLSDYLTEEYGRGLIVQSPIGQLTVDHQSFPFKLSWTHYQVLMAIEDPAERIDFISDEIKKSPSAILDNLKEKIAKK